MAALVLGQQRMMGNYAHKGGEEKKNPQTTQCWSPFCTIVINKMKGSWGKGGMKEGQQRKEMKEEREGKRERRKGGKG